MYSAYLFVAFIFGRTLVVQATDTNLVLEAGTGQDVSTVDTIKFTPKDNGDSNDWDYKVNRYGLADASDTATEVTGITLGALASSTGLKSGTTYYYKLTKTGTSGSANAGQEKSSLVIPFTTAFGTMSDVTVEKLESASATFKWGSFTNYKDTSVKVDSGDKKDLATETYVLEELKPSTKSTVVFQGILVSDSNGKQQSIDICTAPSKPTITKGIEPDTTDATLITLTLTIKFADGEKVSLLDFETGVDLNVEPTCTDCTPTSLAISEKKKFTAELTKDANEVVVVLGKYPEANAATDIQVTAKFDSESACSAANSVGVLETTMNSVATLANKEAMLVYLAIGTMATVLRLLGMEVWTPIGLL